MRYNAAAGAIRNAKMLRDGKPDMVLAFSGGNGTRDMMQQSKRAGMPVLDLSEWDNKGINLSCSATSQ